jgi:hypothetical protein
MPLKGGFLLLPEGEQGLHALMALKGSEAVPMQIRDREQNEETWPRRTPGPPTYRYIDPKVKLAIARSQSTPELLANADEVIEDLGDPMSDSDD